MLPACYPNIKKMLPGLFWLESKPFNIEVQIKHTNPIKMANILYKKQSCIAQQREFKK